MLLPLVERLGCGITWRYPTCLFAVELLEGNIIVSFSFLSSLCAGPKKINLVKGRTPLFFEEFHGWMGVYQTSLPFGVVGWSRQMGAEVEVKARLRSHLLETPMSPIDLILNVYFVDKALKTTIS
jgi:hypothetical protein